MATKEQYSNFQWQNSSEYENREVDTRPWVTETGCGEGAGRATHRVTSTMYPSTAGTCRSAMTAERSIATEVADGR